MEAKSNDDFTTACGPIPIEYFGIRAALAKADHYTSDSPADFEARRKYVIPQEDNSRLIRKIETSCSDDRRWIARLSLIDTWYSYVETDLFNEPLVHLRPCREFLKAARRSSIAASFRSLGLYSNIIAGSDPDLLRFSKKIRADGAKLGLVLPNYGASDSELESLVEKYERSREVAVAESPDCK